MARPRENSPRSLRQVREVKAPPPRAYAAFTEPEHVSRWFMTEAEADLRVGGRYKNADGDTGEYLALDPPNQVAFTWENPTHCPATRVTVTFKPLADDSSTVLETGEPIPHEAWLERSGSE
jgi:uncharacterized protein YndB with AHSA1/START domain